MEVVAGNNLNNELLGDKTVSDKITGVVLGASESSAPKYDEIISTSVTFEHNGRWYDAQVTFREYLDLLQTGHLDGRPVCAVELYTYNVQNEEGDSVKMIYDFVRLHTNQSPWRIS